ncbi:hypothetical protein AMTR_s00041p00213960 [Amborella trichopoda]|uniref:Uncharacterized protein n=1 Tax=Amborella trichopoda TaxID=13333 RepID=W1Q0J7_AMBTC|nr:hypothetical protein AMTR_s00041p00213960 [Amborella trichopoda]
MRVSSANPRLSSRTGESAFNGKESLDNGELRLKNRKIISSKSYGSRVGSKLGGGYGIKLGDVPSGPSPIGNNHGEGSPPSVLVLEGRMLGDVPNGPYPTNGGGGPPSLPKDSILREVPGGPNPLHHK